VIARGRSWSPVSAVLEGTVENVGGATGAQNLGRRRPRNRAALEPIRRRSTMSATGDSTPRPGAIHTPSGQGARPCRLSADCPRATRGARRHSWRYRRGARASGRIDRGAGGARTCERGSSDPAANDTSPATTRRRAESVAGELAFYSHRLQTAPRFELGASSGRERLTWTFPGYPPAAIGVSGRIVRDSKSRGRDRGGRGRHKPASVAAGKPRGRRHRAEPRPNGQASRRRRWGASSGR
jgi:hypothetical protein